MDRVGVLSSKALLVFVRLSRFVELDCRFQAFVRFRLEGPYSFVYLFFVFSFLWFLPFGTVLLQLFYIFSSCLKPKPAKPALLFSSLSLQYSFSIKKCLCFVLF